MRVPEQKWWVYWTEDGSKYVELPEPPAGHESVHGPYPSEAAAKEAAAKWPKLGERADS